MNTVEDAIIFASIVHNGQTRKGKDIPYIFHPLEALLVAKSLTSDTNTLMATVLHDTIEDTDTTYEELATQFSEEVANLVNYETEDKMVHKSATDSWKERKVRQLEILRNAPYEAKIICLADKLANMRELVKDHQVIGDKIWDRFNNNNKTEQVWYYSEIADILADEFHETKAYSEYTYLLRVLSHQR